jgi:hypothetical protein
MSIFATRLGARPTPAQQAQPTEQEGLQHAVTQPLLAAPVGTRPQGACPNRIDWGGVVLHEASEPALHESPAHALPSLNTDEMLAAIDAALRQNIAQVAVHGLLVTE